jgi:uncharacterized protein YjbI with pentapeptide repeats
MANVGHLETLKQGVEVWNLWREGNPDIRPDLVHADLSGAQLSKINFADAEMFAVNLSGANLFASDLSNANLVEANLDNVKLRGADLSGADLSSAVLRGANLSDSNLSRTNFEYSQLIGANFHHATGTGTDFLGANLLRANLNKASLKYAMITRADLTKSDLSGARMSGSKFRGANLSGADLNNTDLFAAILTGADLSGAKLQAANLSEADLSGARLNVVDLTKANLRSVNLRYADLTGAILSGADISAAQIGRTVFGNNDLSLVNVKGLETVIHVGPSTIGIDTIYLSQGDIPDSFLKGAGVPDTLMTYLKSLVGKPFEFYSCFISYSTKDQQFVERIYADLQSKGVRCWFAPQDLKIGDRIRNEIDDSIRLHDKLLLVLSKDSITSRWVEQEVETAITQEDNRKKAVLFPIRLDDAVMETGSGWPALVKKTRYIGDFSRWKDHDSYIRAFERLIRDLTADEPPLNHI